MTSRRQASFSKGGIVRQPLISQSEASEALGQGISDDVWQKINVAFALFGDGMDELDTSRPNDAKNDEQSWHQQQRASVADLSRAFECIDRVARDRKQFLMDALENYCLQTQGCSSSLQTMRELEDMKIGLIRAITFIERAKPFEIDVPTEATLRASLVASIYLALKEAGIRVTISSKGSEDTQTLFEALLVSLGVDVGNSNRAFAMKVRRAIKNGGK